MAFVDNPLEGTELDEEQQKDQGLQGAEVQKVSGEGGTLGSGGTPSEQSKTAPAASQQASVSKRAPTASGRFTNLQSYIKANQPAQFGKEVAGKIGGVAEKASGRLGSEEQKLRTAVETQKAGFVAEPQIQQSFQSLRDLTRKGDIATDAEEERRIAETGVAQKYTGPMQYEGLTELQRRGRDLSALAEQTGSTSGQRSILQRFYGRPDYTGGQQKLDTMLLSGEVGGDLARARQKAAIFDPRLQRSSEKSEAMAQEAKDFATAGRELSRQLAEEGRVGELQELDEIVKEVGKQYQSDIDKYKKDIAHNIAAKQFDRGTLNQLLGGDIQAQDLAQRFGRAKDLATISRRTADPAQARLANYFAELMGSDPVVQDIAESVPDAAKATFYLDPQVQDIQRQSQNLQAEYERARYAQQQAHDEYYRNLGPNNQVHWQIAEKVGAANNRAYDLENRMRALRSQLTSRAAQYNMGGGPVRDLDVHRGQAAARARLDALAKMKAAQDAARAANMRQRVQSGNAPGTWTDKYGQKWRSHGGRISRVR
jgi:hypothetical protein